MDLRTTLNEKTPAEKQTTPEYKILLNLIKKEKITSVEGLQHYITTEIKKNKQCLDMCGKEGSTSNRKRGKEARTINFFKTIEKKIMPHLS